MDNILDIIFDARSEEVAKLSEGDMEFLNTPKADVDKHYKKFIRILEHIPEDTKKNIIKQIDEYTDTLDFVHAYFYKKYYKLGFADAVELMLNDNNN